MTDTAQQLPRVPGKRGRRPVQHVPTLKLTTFRPEAPPAPPSGNVTAGVSRWLMLGNDQFGCCGPAATEHNFMAKALTGAAADGSGLFRPGFVVPTTQMTLSLYFAYGRAMGWATEPGMPGPDQGVDNASWLKFLKDAGVIDLFAELDPTDANQIHQAMLDYHGVIVGVLLTDQAESEFANNQPWNVSAGEQIDPNLGHDILLVEYDTARAEAADTFVTWGALEPATVSWQDAESRDMDAWVVMTKDDAARTGVDSDGLEEEIAGLDTIHNEGLLREVWRDVEQWIDRHLHRP